MNNARSFLLHKLCIIAFAYSFLISEALSAKGSIESETHDAHLHGYAELTIALEGDLLEINFESPAFNIVGFEYKAKTRREIQTVKESQALLEAPERIFSFKGTKCNLKSSEANLANLDDAHKILRKVEPDEYHEHDEHDEQHSQISSDYVYICDSGRKLTGLEIELIRYFPAIHELRVMWVTDEGQGGVNLTKSSKTVVIRQ